jgi:paraquat-inducible protein A
VVCRRCARPYQVSAGAFLPACPYCGASPRGLLPRLRDNRVAATLAFAATATLAVSLFLPFMRMTTLGQERVFSLVGGIAQLYREGHLVIATVLFLFSVIFPFAKLTALLLATSRLAPLSMRVRKLLHKAADLTGKYSLLDVVVVAMLIVMIKFRGVAQVTAESGVVWFCAGVVLSIVAGITVRLEAPTGQRVT